MKYSILAIFLFISVLPSHSFSQTSSEIDEIVKSTLSNFPVNTQVSIAIVDSETVNYYGFIKELDSIRSTDNQDEIFEIGSIAKVFTSVILASLVDEGKIGLNDNINQHFPFPFKDSRKIRYIDLVNHTSGLPRLPQNLDLSKESNPYKEYKEKELFYYLENLLTLQNQPTKEYLYSNLGFGLLGYTLGKSQDSSYEKLLQTIVLDKYNMTNTYTGIHESDSNLVSGLNADGEIVPNWDFDVFAGAGGVLSTSKDLAKFAIAQFNSNDSVLSLARKPTFRVNENMQIGLGWHIMNSKEGESIYWHNGQTGGYSSSITVNVANKKAVVVLTNVSIHGINAGESFSNELFKLVK